MIDWVVIPKFVSVNKTVSFSFVTICGGYSVGRKTKQRYQEHNNSDWQVTKRYEVKSAQCRNGTVSSESG